MEHLTKHQIILLALLVSFVTSIATGIVSVSLMSQAPKGVTQTINQIVERTIEKVSPESNLASNVIPVVVNFEDQTANAVEKVQKSLVRIKSFGASYEEITGLGLIVSKDGIIVTDKETITPLGNPIAIFPDGQEFPIRVIQSQTGGDVVFVLAVVPDDKKVGFSSFPVSFAPSMKLGQTIFSLSGKTSFSLNQGIISKVEGSIGTTTIVSSISTNLPSGNILVGSPSFDIEGNIIGMKTTSLKSDLGTVFYPVNLLRNTIPVI